LPLILNVSSQNVGNVPWTVEISVPKYIIVSALC